MEGTVNYDKQPSTRHFGKPGTFINLKAGTGIWHEDNKGQTRWKEMKETKRWKEQECRRESMEETEAVSTETQKGGG